MEKDNTFEKTKSQKVETKKEVKTNAQKVSKTKESNNTTGKIKELTKNIFTKKSGFVERIFNGLGYRKIVEGEFNLKEPLVLLRKNNGYTEVLENGQVGQLELPHPDDTNKNKYIFVF